MLLRDGSAALWWHGHQLALLAAFARIGGVLDLPFELYSTFRIEQRFGFNRMTWKLYLADTLKGVVHRRPDRPADRRADAVDHGRDRRPVVALGVGRVDGCSTCCCPVLYPTVIAPLFNKFEPLADEALKARVQALMRAAALRPRVCS